MNIGLFTIMLIANAYFIIGWLKAVAMKFLSRLLVILKIGPKVTPSPILPPSSNQSMDKSNISHGTPANLSRVELVPPGNTSMVREDGSISDDQHSHSSKSK